MSVSIVAMEHSLRLISDENKVYMVCPNYKTTQYVSFPYSGTVKYLLRLSNNSSSSTTIEVNLLNDEGDIITTKTAKADGNSNITMAIYANVTKGEKYKFSLSSAITFSGSERLLIYADVIYGNQLGILSE